MEVGDQSEVIAFLARPETHGVDRVERIDTHGAVVFLAGERAYKLKRAVRFPYMDYSTLARREAACRREIELNRRTAPTIYLGVRPVTRRRDGGLEIGGEGPVVDWLVVMRRFASDSLFDRMAARGALTEALMEALADAVAAFHAALPPVEGFGGAAGIRWVVEGNDRGLRDAGAEVFPPEKVAELRVRAEAALAATAALLDRRRREGWVRHCHGDLHLRNICLVDGRPTLFDAIEFNDEIACIDVLYDLAFLLTDLDRRNLRGLANLVFNRYLQRMATREGLAALPLFLSCRAGVAAQVGAARAAAQPDPAAAAALRAEAERELDDALAYLAPPPPRLTAVGGLSGTGKSTLARALAPEIGPAPGAVVLRSDVVRKELAGVDPLTRLGPEAYAAETTAKVYATLRERAAAILAQGHAVVVDAVFAREAERAAIEAVARRAGAAFQGIWLEAPAAVLEARVAARRGDASDADLAVLRGQLAYDTGTVDWTRVPAAGRPEEVRAAARRILDGTRASRPTARP